MFISLSCGACLVVVPDNVKATPSLVSQVLVQRQKVTVLQITPSLFNQLSHDTVSTGLLGGKIITVTFTALLHFTLHIIEFSHLRVLAFGGEVCPSLNVLSKYKNTKVLKLL